MVIRIDLVARLVIFSHELRAYSCIYYSVCVYIGRTLVGHAAVVLDHYVRSWWFSLRVFNVGEHISLSNTHGHGILLLNHTAMGNSSYHR